MKRHTLLFLSLSSLSFVTGTAYALPFSITASGTLPTTYPGSASYTVKNDTASQSKAIIKYLPPNTSIATSGTTCGTSLNTVFTLTHGSSCTLNLTVSGAVDRSDPNPTHHLTVCLSDDVTCAGPNPTNSLNVTAAPSSAEYAFLATGQGPSSGPYANEAGLYACPVDTSTGLLTETMANCAQAPLGDVAIVTGAAFDATHHIVYTVNANLDDVYSCGVSDNIFTTCETAHQSFQPYGVALDPSNDYLYVSVAASGGMIYTCSIGASGVTGSCSSTGPTGLVYPYAIAVTTVNGSKYGYIASGNGSGTIEYCSVSGSGTWNTSCTLTATGFDFLSGFAGIVFGKNNQYAYVLDNSGVHQCTVNSSSGALSGCTLQSATTAGTALGIDPTGSYLYIGTGGDALQTCSINTNGSVTSCSTTGTETYPYTLGIAIS
jgi:hypothetical protein